MTVRIDRADPTSVNLTVMGRRDRELDESSSWAEGRRRKREKQQRFRPRWWDAIVGWVTGRGTREWPE